MLSFADALALISTKVQTHRRTSARASLNLAIDESLGFTCATRVVSGENFPARPTSAMDGFAVQSFLTSSASLENPVVLRVRGEIAAGDEPPVSSEGAWEIMTGAAMPAHCDACIRLEDVVVRERDGVCEMSVVAPVSAGTNVRVCGEDFQVGSEILSAGQVIRSEDILCLATLGIQTLSVYKRPRVAVIATGSELSCPTQPLKHSAQVRNSTTSFLLAALRERGADATFLGVVNDDPVAFHSLFDQADGGDYDLILTTGALSVGRHDFVASALSDRRTNIYFRKVAIRPGKPVLFGQTTRGTFLMGLPGNPIASVVGLRFFVDAFLGVWLGREPSLPLRLPLLDESLTKPVGMTSFFRASFEGSGVRTHSQQKASFLSPLLQTEVWVELPESVSRAVRGDTVLVWPYLSTSNRRSGSPKF